MHALGYHQFGGPEVLAWTDGWPAPVPSAGQVLVRSIAGGVNPKDVLLRKGKFRHTLAREALPRMSGFDVAGEVIEIAPGVEGFAVGDPVYGMTNRFCGGVHAALAALDVDEMAPLPANLDPVSAAAVPLAAQTALQALRDLAGLRAGQTVLIIGASGGVGHFAVQIAKALGAQVHGVCGPQHQAFVASLGADQVHDYTHQEVTSIRLDCDVVFDVFGRFRRRDFTLQLADRGVFVSSVPKVPTIFGEALARVGVSRRARLVIVRSRAGDLQQLGDWIERGVLAPHIEKVYPVADAAAAHRHLETKRTTGKVVLSF